MKFTNHCELICGGLDIKPLQDWLADIPLDEWPEQAKSYGEQSHTMINDLAWNDFRGHATAFIEGQFMEYMAGLAWWRPAVSAILPGHIISTRVDPQGPEWLYRVHVPIWTNPSVCLFMDVAYHLKQGSAYKVNVERKHACVNHGDTPRVHFMFDVRTPDVQMG